MKVKIWLCKKNLLNHKNFQINVNKIFEILKQPKNKIKIDPHIKISY